MQLWGHVRRSAPLRGQVRRQRAQEGASLGAAERPKKAAHFLFLGMADAMPGAAGRAFL